MFTSMEQLNGSGYATWKEKFDITLVLPNIYYALINDPLEAPKESDENYDARKRDYDVEKAKVRGLWS